MAAQNLHSAFDLMVTTKATDGKHLAFYRHRSYA